MAALLLFALAALAPAGGAGTADAERLKPLETAVGDAHRHAISLSRAAAELPVAQLAIAGDDEHETYIALVDADLALSGLADERPPLLPADAVTQLRSELTFARQALGDYAAARTDGRRPDMREAAEGLRQALRRAGTIIDAAKAAPPPSD